MKKIHSILLVSLFALQCARQTTPTGGPKDEEPPILLNSIPTQNQKNYKGQLIELSLNEDVKLKDPKEEILVTPDIGKNTKYEARKNRVIIQPELPLQENTTYSITFREAIQDITESNPAEDLRLAFSTGPIIDSLFIHGNVGYLFNEKPAEKVTVAIYQADTFNIFVHTPIYFTKTNKKGKFTIQNLKPGSYHVYAFDDKNKNLKVESKTEMFGFKTMPIDIGTSVDSVEIKLIASDTRRPSLTTVRHTTGTSLLRFNKALDSLHIEFPQQAMGIYTFGESQNEAIIFKNFLKSDSVKVNIFARDSLNQILDTTAVIKYTETKMAAESFKVKEIFQDQNFSTEYYKHVLSFNKLLLNILYDSIYIQLDSTRKVSINKESLTYDTLLHTVTLEQKIELRKDTALNNPVNKSKPLLIYAPASFISIENDSSKRISKEILLLKEENTGTVAVEVSTNEKNFFIELITTDKKLVQRAKNIKSHVFKFLKPQDYMLRIHIDSNNNGKWDPGNFLKGQEPEKILFYKSDEGKPTFPIRANWEYGPLLIKF